MYGFNREGLRVVNGREKCTDVLHIKFKLSIKLLGLLAVFCLLFNNCDFQTVNHTDRITWPTQVHLKPFSYLTVNRVSTLSKYFYFYGSNNNQIDICEEYNNLQSTMYKFYSTILFLKQATFIKLNIKQMEVLLAGSCQKERLDFLKLKYSL